MLDRQTDWLNWGFSTNPELSDECIFQESTSSFKLIEESLIIYKSYKFEAGSKGMEVVRRQFPIRAAYAMTFNKSQGQTLDRVGVDLRVLSCSGLLSYGPIE